MVALHNPEQLQDAGVLRFSMDDETSAVGQFLDSGKQFTATQMRFK